jgi:hypothetical protein
MVENRIIGQPGERYKRYFGEKSLTNDEMVG